MCDLSVYIEVFKLKTICAGNPFLENKICIYFLTPEIFKRKIFKNTKLHILCYVYFCKQIKTFLML